MSRIGKRPVAAGRASGDRESEVQVVLYQHRR